MLRRRVRRAVRDGSTEQVPTHVALLLWGLAVEDWWALAGMTREHFLERFTGSWLFDEVAALRSAGIDCVLVAVSLDADRLERHVHRPTGTTVWLLPVPRLVRWARRRRPGHWPRSVGRTGRSVREVWAVLLTDAVAYASTPPLALWRLVRREHFAALLVQEYEFPRFDVAVLVGRAARVPVVGIFQGGNYHRWRTERLVRPWTVRWAHALVAGSAREVERVRAAYRLPPGSVHRIANSVDTGLWRPSTPPERSSARAALGLPQDGRAVVWHGRVEVDKKGLDLLVDAWATVLCRCPGATLLLVGGGADEARLTALLRHAGLGASVVWQRGLVHDKAALARVVASCDIAVLPSRHEGFPVALVEATACGLPCVATAVDGAAEILGEQALVAVGDASGLSEQLVALLEAPDLAAASARARQRAIELFDVATVGRRWRQLLST